MSSGSSIEWTDATWNPVRGCTKVSPGCKHCYAETFAERWRGVEGHPYEQGFDLRLVPEKLDEPLRWKKPRRVFVNSMSDLFHESVPFEYLAAVYGVMAVSPHTFQVLTKRPERRLEFHRWLADRGPLHDGAHHQPDLVVQRYAYQKIGTRLPLGEGEGVSAKNEAWREFPVHPIKGTLRRYPWPLRNVWEGVSVENRNALGRLDELRATPASVRFVSMEPLLEDLGDIGQWLRQTTISHMRADVSGLLKNRHFDCLLDDDGRQMTPAEAEAQLRALLAQGVEFIPTSSCDDFDPQEGCRGHARPGLDLVIVGGESGPGARPCDVAWIRSIVEQCKAASVACFVKQLGAKPCEWQGLGVGLAAALVDLKLRDRKGGDPSEWPEDLRVREMPK